MFYLLVSFASLSIVGLTMLILAAHRAPEGYEDANGFHALNRNDLTSTTSVGSLPGERSFGLDDLLFLDKTMASQPWH